MSGYSVAQRIPAAAAAAASKDEADSTGTTTSSKPRLKDASKRGPMIKPNRMKVCERLPTEEALATVKRRKKLLQTGTEQFNVKPAKGIAFLQEHGLLSTPLDTGEVTTYLRENPRLDKKMIGEYVSAKKNAKVLEAFVK